MVTETLPAVTTDPASIVEAVVIAGDLAKLSAAEKVTYYRAVCDSVGLNPLTRPFDYIVLNGKLTLYANKGAGDQLRRIAGVSITKVETAILEDVYTVTVYGTDRTGRIDSEMGAVPVKGLLGEARANAYMKALTKAKRRLTLSLVGLGMLDETEVASIPDARPEDVDPDTGEILRQTRTEQVRGRLEARAGEQSPASVVRDKVRLAAVKAGKTKDELQVALSAIASDRPVEELTVEDWVAVGDALGIDVT